MSVQSKQPERRVEQGPAGPPAEEVELIAPGFYPDSVPDFRPRQAYRATALWDTDSLTVDTDPPVVLHRIPPSDARSTTPPYRPSLLASLLASRYGDHKPSNRLAHSITNLTTAQKELSDLAVETPDFGPGLGGRVLTVERIITGLKDALERCTYGRVRNFGDYIARRDGLWVLIDSSERDDLGTIHARVAPLCGLAIIERGDGLLARAVVRGRDGNPGKLLAVKALFDVRTMPDGPAPARTGIS